jgi:hypothetical protein
LVEGFGLNLDLSTREIMLEEFLGEHQQAPATTTVV